MAMTLDSQALIHLTGEADPCNLDVQLLHGILVERKRDVTALELLSSNLAALQNTVLALRAQGIEVEVKLRWPK